MNARSIVLALIISTLPVFTSQAAEIPYLTGRVTDNANILSPEAHRLLSDSLKAHEERTTNQVVVLTLRTLGGENIEDFANRVFNEWKLGQKDRDNGVLIVVVPDDRRMRIEVGYGLEGALPDLMASRIIQNIMTPRFRNGDFDGGITEGTLAVLKTIEGEYVAETDGAFTDSSSGGFDLSGMESPEMPIVERILIGAFIFGLIGLFTVLGIMTPGVGWFLYIFLIPFWAMFPIIVIGKNGALVCLISYLILFPVLKLMLKRLPWYKKAKEDLATKGKASIGGFTFSSGSSGGGSWSSGGGGFSGGGGSSGGGGASGSW
jgi:uncharacterized protein